VTDPAYVELPGGLLFMDGKSDEAGKLFSESIRQEFSYAEKIRIQFRPRDPGVRSEQPVFSAKGRYADNLRFSTGQHRQISGQLTSPPAGQAEGNSFRCREYRERKTRNGMRSLYRCERTTSQC
jgi:hypothetical protein